MPCIPLFICVSLSSSQCRIEVCDWRSQESEQKYSRCLSHTYNSPGTTNSVENKTWSPTWSHPSLGGFYLDLEPGTGILRMHSSWWPWVSSDLGWDVIWPLSFSQLMPVFPVRSSNLSFGSRELPRTPIFLTDPFSIHESQRQFL